LALWERVRGAPLDAAQATQALARIAALQGHPQQLIEAARAADAAPPQEPREDGARAVLETLRAFAPRAVPRSLIAELSGVPAGAAIADRLAAHGLLHAQATEGDALLSAAAADGRDRTQLRAAGLVRLGELATANPSRRRQALRVLPLLWATLAHAGLQPATVVALSKAWHAPLALAGRWDAWGRMLDSMLEAARTSGDVALETWALHQAGTRCLGIGAHEQARTLFQQALQLGGGGAALQAATQHHLDLLVHLLPPVTLPPAPPPPPSPPGAAPPARPRKWLKVAAVAGAMGVGSAGAWWLLGAPRLEWSAGRVDFDPAVLGQAAAPRKSLLLRNTGWRAAQLTGLQADPPFWAHSECASRPLPGGASCEVQIGFMPTARGEASGKLLVAGAQAIPLAGRALAADLAHAAQIDFGPMDVGAAPLTRSLMVRNTGDAPVHVAVAGVLAAPFAVLRDGCKPARPLAAGAECRIDLRLRAEAAGVAAATLQLRSDLPGAPERSVALRGEGRAAAMELAAAQLDFDATEVGTRSATQALRIRNGGNAPLQPNAALAGGGGEPFVVTPGSCQGPVPPGQSCELYLAFAPTRRGLAQAQLQVAAPNLPRSAVRLSGTATAAALSLTPSVLDFGTVTWPSRTAPAERQLRLANLGDAPLRQTEVSVSAPQFRVVGNDCPPALAPNASCRLTLRFDPSAGGKTFTGALRVQAKNAIPESALVPLRAATSLPPLAAPVLQAPANGTTIQCGDQKSYQVTFRWQPVEAGTGVMYRVTLEPGAAASASTPSLQRTLDCPGNVTWRVQAATADGRRSESETRTLQLRRTTLRRVDPAMVATPPVAPAPTPAATPKFQDKARIFKAAPASEPVSPPIYLR
jgi:hypothetical protein